MIWFMPTPQNSPVQLWVSPHHVVQPSWFMELPCCLWVVQPCTSPASLLKKYLPTPNPHPIAKTQLLIEMNSARVCNLESRGEITWRDFSWDGEGLPLWELFHCLREGYWNWFGDTGGHCHNKLLSTRQSWHLIFPSRSCSDQFSPCCTTASAPYYSRCPPILIPLMLPEACSISHSSIGERILETLSSLSVCHSLHYLLNFWVGLFSSVYLYLARWFAHWGASVELCWMNVLTEWASLPRNWWLLRSAAHAPIHTFSRGHEIFGMVTRDKTDPGNRLWGWNQQRENRTKAL